MGEGGARARPQQLSNGMRPLLLLVAAAFLIGATPGQVPEPAGLWQGPLHGYTPNTVTGASVIDTAGLTRMAAEDHPLLVDVAEADHRPDAMAKSAIWMPSHRSVPDATWLPGAGSGTGDPQFAQAFAARLSALTNGDKGRPVVTFCHPECWGSWNAAKRLAALGYTRVYWYPEGMEGWQAEHDTAIVMADPAWSLPVATDRTQ